MVDVQTGLVNQSQLLSTLKPDPDGCLKTNRYLCRTEVMCIKVEADVPNSLGQNVWKYDNVQDEWTDTHYNVHSSQHSCIHTESRQKWTSPSVSHRVYPLQVQNLLTLS